MKKIGLICITAITCLSLAACGSNNKSSSSKASSSSKVVKKQHKKHNKKKAQNSSFDTKKSTSQNTNSQPNAQQTNSQGNTQQTNNQEPTDADIMAEIHRRNTAAQNAREQPYKGYASYYDYKNANPDQSYSENDDPAYTTGAIPYN